MGFGHGPRRGGMKIEDAADQRKAISRLAAYLKPYAWAIAGVTLLIILSTLGSLAGPIMVGKAIDLYIIPGDVPGLLRMGIILLGVYLASSGTSIAYSLIMVNISQKLIKNIRADLFNHIQTLSMGFFDEHEAGDLMSRITNDTDAINRVLSNGMVQLISNILQLVGILIAMLVLNWRLALGSLVVLPLMVLVTMSIASRTRQAFREVQFNLGALNANAEENISGVRVVRAFAREKETIDQFRSVNLNNRDAGIKAERITALLMPLIHVMSTVAVAIIAGLGGWLALRDLISVGVIVSFISYSYQFFGPIRQLAQLYNQLQSALAGAERIFYVIDTLPTVADRPGAEPLPRIAGRVEFDHVCFAYEEDKPVLKDVSLVAEPGQTIALVGPTGAGKTTIINLLSRFYDVNEGTIRIDGHDIRDIQQKTLRRQLGIVLQDTYLFTETVMDNIRYGRPDATDEEVIEAAKLANADQFISRLPQGYQTKVSEQGSNFSQGQRQLLAIARAVLADPAILILDEATSSVDTRTEMHIQDALLRLMEGRTAFVIAHRLSTIREADAVLVINENAIIERGTHAELLEQRGFYYDLYMSQFRRAQSIAAD
ncbi:MAG: ABC transporter ATP-binding protein [Anaerolineae bacterium]|nr:ABC transporter ATP-binding protein [Anaerolineae bacterium]